MSLRQRLSQIPRSAWIGAGVACVIVLLPLGAFLVSAGLAVGNDLADRGRSTGVFGMQTVAPFLGLILYAVVIVAIPAVFGGVVGWGIYRAFKAARGAV